MFHNDRIKSHSHTEKQVRHRAKKSKSYKKNNISKKAKYSENSKFSKNHKHSKFKCINTVSDYLGPDRLTKHIGFLSKGKISNSISRMEKMVSKEVKARAQQDLREVLKLSHCGISNHKKKGDVSYKKKFHGAQSLQSIYKSPNYSNHKTGFTNCSWKDKLQKSVAVANVNSVLASVHRSQRKSPIKELQLIAKNVLLNKIYPFVKKGNALLFPGISHVNKMRNKLCGIKNKFLPSTAVSFEEALPSGVYENPPVPTSNEKISHTQNSCEDDFHLNPIFTGDVMNQNDFTQIFPPVNDFINDSNNLITDNDLDILANDIYNYNTQFNQVECSVGGSSVTLVPISPITSEEASLSSPAMKLQLSPPKYVPEYDATPTLYFRHKMF